MRANSNLTRGRIIWGTLAAAAMAAMVLCFLFAQAGLVAPATASAAKAKPGKSKLRTKPPRVGWMAPGPKYGFLFQITGRSNTKNGRVIGSGRVTFQGRHAQKRFTKISTTTRFKIRSGIRVRSYPRWTKVGRARIGQICGDQERPQLRTVLTYRYRGGKKRRVVSKPRPPICAAPMPTVIRRPSTPSCDPTDPALCLLPFPNDHFARDDKSTSTGQRLNLADDQMPVNIDGVSINAADYNAADGFSPGQPILTHVPGLDNQAALTQTNAAPVNQVGRYSEPDAPVVLLDTETNQRVPLWVEVDSQADTADRTMLQVHPAVPLHPGRRYVVALRNLKRADGSLIEARSPFREIRDTEGGKTPAGVGAWQKGRLIRMMSELELAGIQRGNLFLTWEFTVASEESTTGRLLSIRDRAFSELGDTNLADRKVGGTAPEFSIDSIERFTPAQDPRILRTIRGRVTVPCFLTPSCDIGGRYTIDAEGLPTRNGTWQAPFVCIVPRSTQSAPARASVYGHGLFHVKEEVEGLNHRRLANDHNIVECATAQIGMSADDVLNTLTGILPNLSHFPQLADRIQQGVLNELFLGRAMIHPQGFIADPAFRSDELSSGDPVIDTGTGARLGYSGYSLGGILGGTFTAVSPDTDRGVLGVPGLRFSMLLPRSTQYDPFSSLLNVNYPDPMARSLILSLLQQLWDRGEPNGFARRITSNPLPNTPPHEVLIMGAIGDHQVTNFGTDILARATGAAARQPLIDASRWPGMDLGWNLSAIPSYPHSGSGLFYVDTGPTRPGGGTDPPPLINQPNRTGSDPHGVVWSTTALRQSVSDFLQPAGKVTNPCGSTPCYAGGWAGP